MMEAKDAMEQGWMTANVYARRSIDELCHMLDIDCRKPDWRKQLAPFAGVWAAMITAAASDYTTAIEAGVVSNTKQNDERDHMSMAAFEARTAGSRIEQ